MSTDPSGRIVAVPLSQLPAETWPSFSRLLDEALDLDVSARQNWLQELPPEHAGLREFLDAALRANAELQLGPPRDRPRLAIESEETLFQPGARIGPYELLAPLGRGGMGEVWRARRVDGTLTRDVALKLPHTWLLTAGTRLRLSRERDILAGLTHPHVAQLYDAGIAENGQPWLALEKIEGVRIDAFCRGQALSITQRLHLFGQVLDAVQAAHARLIVHRDLKPANILVDTAGQVKLLDFGIAKLVDDQGTGESTQLTQLAGRAATPDYAAPEQLAGETITVATDVYALGVVLFELLTGKRPFDSRKRLPDTVWEPPPLASEKLDAEHARHCARAHIKTLRRELQGDLDAILAKALSHKPRDRYASAHSLRDDLNRHRRSEAIEARHITRLERVAKFVRRNRLALGFGSVLTASILAGAGISLWQAQRALDEAARANATKDFLIGVFGESDRTVARDIPAGEISARDLLDISVERIGTGLSGQAETQLELLDAATDIYALWKDRPRFDKAMAQRKALAIATYGPDHPEVIECLMAQAVMTIDERKLEQARPFVVEAGRLIQKNGLQHSRLAAEWWFTVAEYDILPQGMNPERLLKLAKSQALYERHAPQDPELLWVLMETGREYYEGDDFERARDYTQRAIDLSLATPQGQRNDWLLGGFYSNLGAFKRLLGDAAGAIDAYERSGELILRTFGPADRDYWNVLAQRAKLLHWRGELDAAHAIFDKSLLDMNSVDRETLGDAAAWVRHEYGMSLLAEGRPAEALPLLEAASKIPLTEYLLPTRPADIRLSLGEAYEALGRTADARREFKAAYDEYRGLTEPSARDVLEGRERWGRFLLDHPLDHPEEAEQNIEAAETEFQAVLSAAAQRPLIAVARARAGLARIARLRGDVAGAMKLSAKAVADLTRVREARDLRRDAWIGRLHAEMLEGPRP